MNGINHDLVFPLLSKNLNGAIRNEIHCILPLCGHNSSFLVKIAGAVILLKTKWPHGKSTWQVGRQTNFAYGVLKDGNINIIDLEYRVYGGGRQVYDFLDGNLAYMI